MNLHQAIAAAVEAHGETVNDKSGELYIRHPLRVMEACGRLVSDDREDCMIVGVLHDVVEDTGFSLSHTDEASFAGAGGWSLYDPATGLVLGYLSDDQAEALEAVTRRSGESYEAFIDRCRENPIALRVKLADITDNLDPERALNDPKAESRRRRYEAAHERLTHVEVSS
jgi:(p)ppGpp synthase/HD superfamily hydrolase